MTRRRRWGRERPQTCYADAVTRSVIGGGVIGKRGGARAGASAARR